MDVEEGTVVTSTGTGEQVKLLVGSEVGSEITGSTDGSSDMVVETEGLVVMASSA